MREINRHIIHCSASRFGNVKIFRRWHKARGWRDVGYHFIIRRDGEIEIGRMLHEKGAHCLGHNDDSVGTCLVGNKTFTEAQFKSLRRVNKMLKEVFPGITAHPHNEYTDLKTCPNFDIAKVL